MRVQNSTMARPIANNDMNKMTIEIVNVTVDENPRALAVSSNQLSNLSRVVTVVILVAILQQFQTIQKQASI